MRLIDADELYKRIDGANYQKVFRISIKNAVKDMPTIDNRGVWRETDDGTWLCSRCGEEAYWDADYGQQLFDYCPSCGSRNIKE